MCFQPFFDIGPAVAHGVANLDELGAGSVRAPLLKRLRAEADPLLDLVWAQQYVEFGHGVVEEVLNALHLHITPLMAREEHLLAWF